MTLSELKSSLLDLTTEENKNGRSPILTGETNLKIKKEDLIEKVRQNEHGEGYLEVMTTESGILAGQGLFNGYIENGKIYFDIPDYDRFISAVNAFYEVCYAPCNEAIDKLNKKFDVKTISE